MYFGCEFASRVAIKCNFTLLDVKRERNLLILEGTGAGVWGALAMWQDFVVL